MYAPRMSAASPFTPCPMLSSSLHRSNPCNFQSNRSVTTTALSPTPPCTSLQSLLKNATAVAISHTPSEK